MTFIRQGGRARLEIRDPETKLARCIFPCQDPKAPAGRECSVRCRPKGAPHRGDGPDWEYEGPPEAVTLHPSINCCSDTCWHGWVRGGVMTG
jgi:hypothetical protein